MSGRGENQRPLTSPDGRDLRYASLLFSAIWSRRDKPGGRFFCLIKKTVDLPLYTLTCHVGGVVMPLPGRCPLHGAGLKALPNGCQGLLGVKG